MKSALNLEQFQKSDDPHSRCISQITFSEISDWIKLCKIRFKKSLPQKTWQKGPKTVEMCTTLPLRCFFIPVNITQLEKVYDSAMKILRLFVNPLTDNDKYSLLYRDNLMQPIQVLLSQKQKTFSQLFWAFLKPTLNFAHFQTNTTFIADVFPKLPSRKKVIR